MFGERRLLPVQQAVAEDSQLGSLLSSTLISCRWSASALGVSLAMKVHDYNGEGRWSKDKIIHRYSQYCRELKVPNPIDLSPVEHVEGETKWIYPAMDKVIAGIEQGDAACRRIGIEFIEEDRRFTFGKILKSNTARALRRNDLTSEEQERIRRRLVEMLLNGNVPHEFKQYAKLLKKIGIGEYWAEVERRVDHSNKYVMRYYNYLKDAQKRLQRTRNEVAS